MERRIAPRHLAAEPGAVPAAGAADRDPGAGHGGQSGAAPSRGAEADAAVRDRRGGAGHAERVCHLQLPDKREAPDGRRAHPPAGHLHGAPGAARCHGLSRSALVHPQRRGCPTPSAAAEGEETLQDGRWEPGCWLSAASRLWAVSCRTAGLGGCARRIHINQKYEAVTEWLTLSNDGLFVRLEVLSTLQSWAGAAAVRAGCEVSGLLLTCPRFCGLCGSLLSPELLHDAVMLALLPAGQ